jgi:tRNA A-37 threonylcarbamoyl transferase component Bud32
LARSSEQLNAELNEQILAFCRHIAGSCKTKAAYVCGDRLQGVLDEKTVVEVVLVIHDYQPRLINYLKPIGNRNVSVLAVDEWVFERDVDRGFLGEALVGGLVFRYTALMNGKYLHLQEVKLKRRLTTELLENLVISFPEFSYEFYIKPEYFMFETMLTRTRLFPPLIEHLQSFMRRDNKEENLNYALGGYLEALRELEKEGIITFSDGYVKMSLHFVDRARSQRVRFTNLFKTGQRTLFVSLLSTFPKLLGVFSQNIELSLGLQRVVQDDLKLAHRIEVPEDYLFVPTARGLVPLTSKMNIEVFARKVLSADKNVKIKVERLGGILNDVFLVKTIANGTERKIVVKRFRDWSSFKWFPLTLWSVGTRTFAVLGLPRLEKECAINQLLYSNGFAVPKVLHVSPSERLVFSEYVEGENLDKVIKRIANSKSVSEIKKDLETVGRVGETFAKVHALGIALGDTKPENLVVGEKGEVYLLDFEQASRNGDHVWDVAEFLYYAGHYIPPFVEAVRAEFIAKAFIKGYLKEGGSISTIKKAGTPKYTKVFSIFTFPHLMFAISNICRKPEKIGESTWSSLKQH